ncbi:MAG TPA: AMP-binding protein [Pseudobacteroides sp.]|uniref:phenylacetate--CoA ligase family protein n=1 Tax=Pseudobacteroides sp. TaxID=1968840 RepID=UPI002F936779
MFLNENVLKKLNETLTQSRKSHFNRNRIPDRKIVSLEDFKSLPFTTKDDIINNSPNGFICVPKKELYQYHDTFSFSGGSSVSWFTKSELIDCAKRINSGGIGFNEDDRVLIRFPYALSTTAHFTHIAAQMKNACVIPTSSKNNITPFTRIVYMMKKLDVTVLATMPIQALLIAETAQMMGYNLKSDFSALRAIYTAGEALTSSKRKLIERMWGVPIYDYFSTAEVGPLMIECEHRKTHPLDENFLFEVLDENLDKEVASGEAGTLAITTLNKKATPLIRYLTGDRAKVTHKECPCGRKVSMEIDGRKRGSVVVEDREFDIWILEEMVSHLPINGMWLSIPFRNGIKFLIEKHIEDDQITDEMIKWLEENYRVPVFIDFVEKGSLNSRYESLKMENEIKYKDSELYMEDMPYYSNSISYAEIFHKKILYRTNILFQKWKV